MLRKSIALTLLSASALAQAAAEDKGLYAGVGIGHATVKASEAGITFEGSDTAFRISGGYQINRNFAIEGAYLDLGTPQDTIQGVDVELDASAFQGALLGIVPFGGNLSGFAKAGVIFWDATATASDGFNYISSDDSGNEFSWGLGLQLGFGTNARARLEFEGADISGTEYRLISLGFSWLFN